MSSVTFSDLRSASFCPRQCYYDRQDGRGSSPPHVERVKSLAFRYEALLAAAQLELATQPIAIDPAVYQRRLAETRATHDRWTECCEPAAREVLVRGRDCRGIVDKVLEDPLEPVFVSAGSPPDRGVWENHAITAVGAAKALAWEYEESVSAAYVEYPSHGVVRRIELTTPRKAAYRRALRTVQEMDGPPSRTNDRSKCEHCEYVSECGVRTRTLRSLLGWK